MKLSLANRDKISMLFLGKTLAFNYDNPGPIEIRLESLTPDIKNQILYNCRNGVLLCDDIAALKKSCAGLPAAAKTFSTPAEAPVTKVKSVMDIMANKAEANKTELRNLLKEKIGVIKARSAHLPLQHLKILLSLEKNWKKRKAVVSLLDEMVAKQTKSVVELLGPEDVGMKVYDPKMTKLDEGQVVEDSEIEQVSLNIPDEAEFKRLLNEQNNRPNS